MLRTATMMQSGTSEIALSRSAKCHAMRSIQERREASATVGARVSAYLVFLFSHVFVCVFCLLY